jgi:hypothetical protein
MKIKEHLFASKIRVKRINNKRISTIQMRFFERSLVIITSMHTTDCRDKKWTINYIHG